MRRRHFLAGLGAAILIGCTPTPAPAEPPFEPTRFTVEVKGSGPDVILIPGLTAGPNVWAGTVTSVPGYRYHLVHVRGMAGAPVGANARGAVVAGVADELARYIASRGIRPALVGHSMGGTLAMMVASAHPESVSRVMVVDMLPQPAGLLGGSAQQMGGLADRLRDLTASPGGRRLFADLIGTLGTSGDSDPDVVARAMHELSRLDLTPQLPRIAAPLTIVYANADAGTRARTDAAYTRSYATAPGAAFVRIDGSGHMIMYDQPRALHQAVRSFLAG
ncbi:MAG TPA: alpha/beta hydrolase [Allosphingosinicella sp.]|jgi:pimeloyl-ACP methyl ester carboxylesterase